MMIGDSAGRPLGTTHIFAGPPSKPLPDKQSAISKAFLLTAAFQVLIQPCQQQPLFLQR